MPFIIPILFIFSTFKQFAQADVIGVNLEEASAEDKKPKGIDDDLVTSSQGFDSVHKLNRITFAKTILEEHEDEVPHWIVLFCPPWYEPCQAIAPVFRQLSEKWQAQLNGALLSTEVRFATVDCASDKALCNTQRVDTYPMVSHYEKRQQVKIWRGKSYDSDKQRLMQFLQKELGPLAAALGEPLDTTEPEVTPEGSQNFRVDFLLIFAAIAGNAWFISRSGCLEASAASKQTKAARSMPSAGGPASPSVKQATQDLDSAASPQSSCVARSLPKEWAQERPSLEL
jgi:thiol-disulfide isomerase/thioredoxin